MYRANAAMHVRVLVKIKIGDIDASVPSLTSTDPLLMQMSVQRLGMICIRSGGDNPAAVHLFGRSMTWRLLRGTEKTV